MAAMRTKVICCTVGTSILLLVIASWLYAANSRIKVAPAFTQRDVKDIRSAVSKLRQDEVRRSIAAHDLKRLWHDLPVVLSRLESIAGFPGPPGGAYVVCRGLVPGTWCGFMVFNSTNGWKCDRIDVIDVETAREIRREIATDWR